MQALLAPLNKHILIAHHHAHLLLLHEIPMIPRQRLAILIVHELRQAHPVREHERADGVVVEQLRFAVQDVLDPGPVRGEVVCLFSVMRIYVSSSLRLSVIATAPLRGPSCVSLSAASTAHHLSKPRFRIKNQPPHLEQERLQSNPKTPKTPKTTNPLPQTKGNKIRTYKRISNRPIFHDDLPRHPCMPRVIVRHEILIRHPRLLLDHDRALDHLPEPHRCRGAGIARGEGRVELH